MIHVIKVKVKYTVYMYIYIASKLLVKCFDAVGGVTGMESGLL